MDWAEHVDEDAERDLVRWRRHLHQHPELSFEEFETTAYVSAMLDESQSPLRVLERLKGRRLA